MSGRIDDDGTITIGPEPADAAAVAILLHSRGGSPTNMRDLVAAIAVSDIRFVMPAAPGGTWYPQGFMAPFERNEPALSASLARVARMVDDLIAGGVPAERMVLGGFSQGACLAAEHIIRQPRRYAAAFILTGGFIGPPGTRWPVQPALTGVPIYLSGSKIDAWVPVDRVLETERILRASGAEVTARIFDTRGHLVDDEEIAAVRAMLAGLVKKR